MSRIGGKNTTPELIVRRVLRAMAYSFSTHVKSLPGKPDIVMRAQHCIILVHGCFWHRHSCALGQPVPATRVEFWTKKFADNTSRDARNIRTLRGLGWRVMVVWECQTKNPDKVARRLARFLEQGVAR